MIIGLHASINAATSSTIFRVLNKKYNALNSNIHLELGFELATEFFSTFGHVLFLSVTYAGLNWQVPFNLLSLCALPKKNIQYLPIDHHTQQIVGYAFNIANTLEHFQPASDKLGALHALRLLTSYHHVVLRHNTTTPLQHGSSGKSQTVYRCWLSF